MGELDSNPLDLIERDLIGPSVVEARRTGALVIGHLLSDLQPATVLQISSDTSSSEGMAAYLGLDSGR